MKKINLYYALLPIALSVFPNKAVFAEPLSGAGSISPENNYGPNTSPTSSSGVLQAAFTAVTVAVKSTSMGQVESALADFIVVGIKKTNPELLIHSGATKTAIQRRIAAHLKSSVIKSQTFGSALEKIGVGALKSLLINAAIGISCDLVYERTKSLAAKEAVWLGLKNAEVYLTSGGNPVSIAVGQSMILKDVVVKDIEAAKEAIKSDEALDKSIAIGKISNLISSGARQYVKGKSSLIATNDAIRYLIKNSDLSNTSQQELLDTYLSTIGTTRVVESFVNTRNNRDNRLQQLIEGNSGQKFETFIQALYPESEHQRLRLQFDNYVPPVQAEIVEVKDGSILVLSGNEEGGDPLESITLVNPDNDNEEDLKAITEGIAKKEKELAGKKGAYEQAKKNLKGTDRYVVIETEHENATEHVNTTYDSNKVALLEKAKGITQRNKGNKWKGWPLKDRIELGNIGIRLGLKVKGHAGKAKYLKAQFKHFSFDSLINKYAAIESTSTSTERYTTTETIINKDYLKMEGALTELQNEIKNLNQDLTQDKIEQSDLQLSVNNLIDVNNTTKVVVAQNNDPSTSTPAHESWWEGNFTENPYTEDHLGEPILYGFGDGPAETRSETPGFEEKLYFIDHTNDQVTKTITLQNTEAEYLGSYSYVAWGDWSEPNAAQKVYTSHWVVIDQIDRDQKPQTGSATYNGDILGTLWNIGQANTVHNANGSISLNADFGANRITGNMTVRNADTGANFATATFNTNMTSSSDGDGLGFQGQLTGAGISNQQSWHSAIRGEFGGNQAAEVGGGWSVTKGTGSLGDGQSTGVFRAKKQ